MEIEIVELMHEYSPEHLRMETAGLKQDKETGKKGKQKEWILTEVVCMKKSPYGLTIARATIPRSSG